jgi:hypothetical protein
MRASASTPGAFFGSLAGRLSRWLGGIRPGHGERLEPPPGCWQVRDNETLSLRPGRGGVLLRPQRGTFLVTQEGDPLDHLLGQGDEFRAAGRRLVVAWALSDGAIAADPVPSHGPEAPRPGARTRLAGT